MKWRASSNSRELRHYEIKYDPSVGFYLYVFEGKKCIRDDLQETLEMVVEYAFKNFGVSFWARLFEIGHELLFESVGFFSNFFFECRGKSH